MEKVISFVIPAYNSEKFLNKCLDSFMTGDDTQDLIEVLVISDGSKDHTCDIAREYEEKYPGIVKLIAKENGGHGSVINVGAEHASGRYMKVIDADDWVDTKVLSAYVRQLKEMDADVVLTHYRTIDVTTHEEADWKVRVQDYARTYTLEDVHADWSAFGDCMTFHGITYGTEFYRKHGTKMCEKVFYEDHQFATIPACFAETIRVIDAALYIYRIGDVNQSVSDANQYKRRSHMQAVIEDMNLFYQNHEKDMTEHGRYYYTEKLGRLMLAYYTTLLMCSPSFKAGRKEAAESMAASQKAVPSICDFISRRYSMMVIMNHLHISKNTFQKLLHSRLYALIKKS